MRKRIMFLLILLTFYEHFFLAKAASTEPKQATVTLGVSEHNSSTTLSNDDHTKKIFEQERLIKEGSNLVEQGLYDEAIMKYQEAMKSELLLHDYDIDRPILLMATTLKFQGKFEEALRRIQEVLKKYPNAQANPQRDEKLELEALIKARDTSSKQPIYQHINYLRKKYKDELPPNAGARSDAIASPIIRLYDYLGDHDRGIEFVEGFLKRCAEGITCKGNERKLAYTQKHPYFPIYQAFLEDKKEGRKSCIAAKPGKVCMGRATRALIQSDYFPW